jgi:hypothetical protein
MEFLVIGIVCAVLLTGHVRRGKPPFYYSVLELVILTVVIATIALAGPAPLLRGRELPGHVSVIRPPAPTSSDHNPAPTQSFFTRWQGALIGCFYFAVMVLGMGGEYMFRLKRWSSFKLDEFVRPLWVALIVFGVPWATVDKSVVTLSSVIACYQNGFFWKLVLERQRPRR